MYSFVMDLLPQSSLCPIDPNVSFDNWHQDISDNRRRRDRISASPVNRTHNIGFWADELVPMSWVNTLRFRTVTVHEAMMEVRPATG